MKEITKEDLIVGETVLTGKTSGAEYKYIDCGMHSNVFFFKK